MRSLSAFSNSSASNCSFVFCGVAPAPIKLANVCLYKEMPCSIIFLSGVAAASSVSVFNSLTTVTFFKSDKREFSVGIGPPAATRSFSSFVHKSGWICADLGIIDHQNISLFFLTETELRFHLLI